MPSQFENPQNPNTHYLTTGPEIYESFEGKVDILVAGVGTGGTISGTGKYLKEKIDGFKVIAVEPFDSPVLTQGKAGPHKITGIGAGFVPNTLNTSIYDEVITVQLEDAFNKSRLCGVTEGVLIGVSSGAALNAAIEVGSRAENKGKKIIVIFPDNGERYLSTDLYA
jgi:cysteine synthase A